MLEAEKELADKRRKLERLVWKDIQFFVERLAVVFTGKKATTFSPSYIDHLEAKLQAKADAKK